MDVGGAYGGGKAGAPFDPITFAQRPQVILKGVCGLLGLIAYWCVGGANTEEEGKEVCLFNKDASACWFGSFISIIAFLAGAGFLAGEYFFEQMSSVKTRKHYVLGDLGFSGFWAFLCFIGFFYLTNAWSKTETPKDGVGVGSVKGAIVFIFFSLFAWAGSAWFAFLRFKQGTDAAFASQFEADPSGGAGYTSYPDGNDAAYQDPPFSQQQQQRGMGDFQAPAY